MIKVLKILFSIFGSYVSTALDLSFYSHRIMFPFHSFCLNTPKTNFLPDPAHSATTPFCKSDKTVFSCKHWKQYPLQQSSSLDTNGIIKCCKLIRNICVHNIRNKKKKIWQCMYNFPYIEKMTSGAKREREKEVGGKRNG